MEKIDLVFSPVLSQGPFAAMKKSLELGIDNLKFKAKHFQPLVDPILNTKAVQAIEHGLRLSLGKFKISKESLSNFRANLTQAIGMNMGLFGSPLQTSIAMGLRGISKTFTSFAGLDESVRKLASIATLTDSEMEAFKKHAIAVSENLEFSAKEIAEGMKFLAMAGYEKADIQGAIQPIARFASAFSEDIAKTADIVSNISSAYGLSAKDTEDVVKTLTVAANRANVDISMLGETFRNVGGIGGALKESLPLDEMAFFAGVLGNTSDQGATAGTHLKMFATRLFSGPKMAQDALAQLGIETADSSGKLKKMSDVFKELSEKLDAYTEKDRTRLGKELFGEEAFSSALTLMGQIKSGQFDKLKEEALKKDEIFEKGLAMREGGINVRFKKFLGTIENAAMQLFEALAPSIEGLFKLAATVIPPLMKTLKPLVGLLGILLERAIAAGQFIADSVIKISSFMEEVISAVFGLAKYFSEVISGAFESLKNFFLNFEFINTIISTVGNLVLAVAEIMKSTIAAIFGVFRASYQKFIDFFVKIWEWLKSKVSFFSKYWKGDTKEARKNLGNDLESIGPKEDGQSELLKKIVENQKKQIFLEEKKKLPPKPQKMRNPPKLHSPKAIKERKVKKTKASWRYSDDYGACKN